MQAERTYLDYNASAPLRPQARAAVLEALEFAGNPSSIHREGRNARALVEKARSSVGALAGVLAKQVVFTSGGTEAANLALTPQIFWSAAPGGVDLLLVSAAEHACVLSGHRFAAEQVRIAPITASGQIDLARLAEMLTLLPGKKVMLALQHANNETGIIQPVAEAARLVHAHGGIVLCDAVQSAGRTGCGAAGLGADMLVFSAHKLGGPKGVGALIIANAGLHIRQPLVRGGGQEGGARSGTENVAGIAGFGAAAAAALQDMAAEAMRLRGLRGRLERELLEIAPDAVIFGQATERLPNGCAFAVAGVSAETLLIGLDLEGIAVSSGSACSSGKVKRSHVLDAMGVEAGLAGGALRVSFGWSSTQADVTAFIRAYEKVLRRVQRLKAAA